MFLIYSSIFVKLIKNSIAQYQNKQKKMIKTKFRYDND